MGDINKVILIGRVGKTMEESHSGAGMMIGKFSMATNRSVKVAETWKTTTTWHNVVAFGKLAENMKGKVLKGARIYLEGEISVNEHNGVRYNNIIASMFSMQEKSTNQEVSSSNIYDEAEAVKENDDDLGYDSGDLPF